MFMGISNNDCMVNDNNYCTDLMDMHVESRMSSDVSSSGHGLI